MFHVNSIRSITLPKISSVNLNVWIINKYSYFLKGPIEYNCHIPRSWNRPTWLNNAMEKSGYGHALELLIISYQSHVSYPMSNRYREENVHFKTTYLR